LSEFTRRNRGLLLSFPASGISQHEPGDLSEFVQLVHPIFGPLARVGVGERLFASATEAVGQQIAVMTTAPADRVRCVEFASAFHDDAAVRHVRYRVQEANGGILTYVQSTVNQGSGAGIAANLHVPLMRSIFLGPGEAFWVQCDVGGTFAISWQVAFTDYTSADVPLL
jgi:hypothetical protein